MPHKMVKVKMAVTLDAENPNDKVAIIEAKRWKALQEEGKKEAYLLEQKNVFMAGIYLHAVAPQLCNNLAQNLASASLEELQSFNKLTFKDGIEGQQLEGMLDKLSELQELINSSIEANIACSNNGVKQMLAIAEQTLVAPAESIQLAPEVPVEEQMPVTPPASIQLAVEEQLPVAPPGTIQTELTVIPETEVGDKLKKMRKMKSKKIF